MQCFKSARHAQRFLSSHGQILNHFQLRLTTVRQPREEMGREAAALLVRLIRGEPSPPDAHTRRLEVSFRPAASTAAPRRARA